MISFLICAFNEEDNIEDTYKTIIDSLQSAKINSYQIVIINDGSSDLTEEKIKKIVNNDNNVMFETNNVNLGYGYSLTRGLKLINYEKFMIVPGDNDLSKGTILSGLKNLKQADMVMMFPINTDNRNKTRNIVSILYRLIFLIFFDCNVNYINSPCIYPTKKLKDLYLHSKRFSIISEINTKLLKSDISYCEVPTFFSVSLRERKTVTLKNLYDVILSFLKLFVEIKIKNKSLYLKKSKRINIY
jgi:glycosyltransferase involved in cell wall biosynthesis